MRYYNVTRGPVSASLSNGKSCMFRATSWTEVPEGLDNSSSLVEYVNKGILVKNTQDVAALINKQAQVIAQSAPVAPKATPVAPKVAPVAAPKAAPVAPVVVEAPKPAATPVVESPTNK